MLALSEDQELSAPQRVRFFELEQIVGRDLSAFLECAKALAIIRDDKLYREHYQYFEEYLLRRWGLSKTYARNLMNSALVAKTSHSTVTRCRPT